MSQLKKGFWAGSATLLVLLQFACGPNSPSSTGGNIKLNIMNVANQATNAATRSNPVDATMLSTQAVNSVTITRARVVIDEIEFENSVKDTVDYEMNQPIVQDLMLGTTMQQITTVSVPYGIYEELEIEIDTLDPDDGAVYTQNPDLQNLSVRVDGYLNGDTTNTFIFMSTLCAEQEMEFYPPLAVDSTNATTSVVLTVDTSTWFVNKYNNQPLDPTLDKNRRTIEKNIKASLDVFEDYDEDGKKDDYDYDD